MGASVASVAFISVIGARTVNYGELSRGSFHALLNRVEMAGLLSGLDAHETNLVLAKYRDDEAAERALRAHVRLYAVGLALEEQWKITKGRPIVCNMGALAVFEVISPGCCRRCNGTGMVFNHACNTCNSSGYKPASGRAKAKFVGVDEKQWRQVWNQRYERIYRYLLDMEASTETKLAAIHA